MELSRRPVPEVPWNPAELAEAVRKTYDEFNPAIEKCFEGVTEAEASRRPAEKEWSAKEALAHLENTNTQIQANDQHCPRRGLSRLHARHRAAFTWGGPKEPAPTKVVVSLAPKDGGALVTVSHSGIGAGKAWAATMRGIEQGWPEGLENPQSVLETGIDLRQARLPRLGIFVGDFNAEIAAQLGVPVRQGIHIEGTAEGTGARAAGLEKGDVLVKLGGKKTSDFPSLARALQGRTAGDVVLIEFYRVAEKKTARLELSKRPTPDVPRTGAELAEKARKQYAELGADWAKLLDGLTDEQANFKPDAESWSVKEIIAHFIACERDYQSWAADMLNDNKVDEDLQFRPNVNERLRAIVARFNTVPALVEELRQAQAESVALLEALPEKFVARKHTYYRAALWIAQVVPGHLREEHWGQLQTTIEAAREAGRG